MAGAESTNGVVGDADEVEEVCQGLRPGGIWYKVLRGFDFTLEAWEAQEILNLGRVWISGFDSPSGYLMKNRLMWWWGRTKCFQDTEINSWKDFGGYIKNYALDEPQGPLVQMSRLCTAQGLSISKEAMCKLRVVYLW